MRDTCGCLIQSSVTQLPEDSPTEPCCVSSMKHKAPHASQSIIMFTDRFLQSMHVSKNKTTMVFKGINEATQEAQNYV